jgi:hypothetical protein
MSISDDVVTTTADGTADVLGPGEHPAHAPIRPLLAAGVVVTKAALIDALRIYVPQLLDVEPLDQDRFFLRTSPEGARLNGGV